MDKKTTKITQTTQLSSKNGQQVKKNSLLEEEVRDYEFPPSPKKELRLIETDSLEKELKEFCKSKSRKKEEKMELENENEKSKKDGETNKNENENEKEDTWSQYFEPIQPLQIAQPTPSAKPTPQSSANSKPKPKPKSKYKKKRQEYVEEAEGDFRKISK